MTASCVKLSFRLSRSLLRSTFFWGWAGAACQLWETLDNDPGKTGVKITKKRVAAALVEAGHIKNKDDPDRVPRPRPVLTYAERDRMAARSSSPQSPNGLTRAVMRGHLPESDDSDSQGGLGPKRAPETPSRVNGGSVASHNGSSHNRRSSSNGRSPSNDTSSSRGSSHGRSSSGDRPSSNGKPRPRPPSGPAPARAHTETGKRRRPQDNPSHGNASRPRPPPPPPRTPSSSSSKPRPPSTPKPRPPSTPKPPGEPSGADVCRLIFVPDVQRIFRAFRGRKCGIFSIKQILIMGCHG